MKLHVLMYAVVAGQASLFAADLDVARELSQSDASARETAIRQMIENPSAYRAKVVDACAAGDLNLRVNALEILKSWGAPVDQLDPWQPETMTDARMAELKSWAAKVPTASPPTTAPATLSAAQREDAAVEIRRLLAATTPQECAGISERLVRLGPPLVAELADYLNDPKLEPAQKRMLLRVKYEVLASRELLKQWPDGPEKITSTDAATRLAAATELAGHVTASDTALLLALFTDDDAMVREVSLRALKAIKGPGVVTALSTLLEDPEPNVRAAVLKELFESDNKDVVPAIIAYIQREKDEDLLGHAVRVLRSAKDPAAVDCLLSLLDHPAWRIRAEAAEALAQSVGESEWVNGKPVENPAKAKISKALAAHLDDPDGFVVSRVLAGLKKAGLPDSMIDAAVHASEKYPDITLDVVALLCSDTDLAVKAMPHLKKFAADPNPAVRLLVVSDVGSNLGIKARAILLPALSDSDREVRAVAITAYAEELFKVLPEEGMVEVSGGLFSGSKRVPVDSAKWLVEFNMGKRKPAWLKEAAPVLLNLADKAEGEEMAALSSLLLALGKAEPVNRYLDNLSDIAPKQVSILTNALPWMDMNRQSRLARLLWMKSENSWQQQGVLNALDRLPSEELLKNMWELVGLKPLLEKHEYHLQAATRLIYRHYFGESYFYVQETPEQKAKIKKLTDDLQPMLQNGSESQRLLALGVLAAVDSKQAVALAQKWLDDPEIPAGNRRDALQILLAMGSSKDADALAVKYFPIPETQPMALAYLTGSRNELFSMRGGIYLTNILSESDITQRNQNKPIKPEAPAGLTADMVRPLIKSEDAEVRMRAAYLLCLLQEKSALEILEKELNGEERMRGSREQRMLYRAIAALNDESRVPTLQSIYKTIKDDTYEATEFYWTIQSMTGTQITQLQQRVAKDINPNRSSGRGLFRRLFEN